MDNKFTEEDKKKLIQFLNLIATKAKFEFNTDEVIKYFGLLSFMQKEMIPKVEANIFEILEVNEPEEE